MPITLGMIPLQHAITLDKAAIEAFYTEHRPEATLSDMAVSDGGIVSFNIDNTQIYITPLDAPIPWADLEGPCATAMLWRDPEASLKAHEAHVLVATMIPDDNADDEMHPLYPAAMLTDALTAVLNSSDAALGVYWGAAGLVVEKSIFTEIALECLPDDIPVMLWVDFRVGQDENSESQGFTQGLNLFGLKEIEVPHSPESVDDLRNRLMNISLYLLQNGPVIQSGDTLGEDETALMRAVYSESVYGYDEEVMRIVYEPTAQEKKPFWKKFSS